MHVTFRHCATRLSNEVHLIPFAQRNDTMGEDFLLPGTALQDDGSYFPERVGAYFVNLQDATNLHLTTDTKRLNGCCELDGCDGPNLLCNNCNSYVATKVSDCWTPHFVIFDLANTKLFG